MSYNFVSYNCLKGAVGWKRWGDIRICSCISFVFPFWFKFWWNVEFGCYYSFEFRRKTCMLRYWIIKRLVSVVRSSKKKLFIYFGQTGLGNIHFCHILSSLSKITTIKLPNSIIYWQLKSTTTTLSPIWWKQAYNFQNWKCYFKLP